MTVKRRAYTEISQQFAELKAGSIVSIQILRSGERDHQIYGHNVVNPEVIQDVIKHFEDDTRGIKIIVDEDHDPNHAAMGEITELYQETPDDLFAKIELTQNGADKL